MPTRYYLVGADLVREVSRLEAGGGVRDAESAVDPTDIEDAHRRYADERDSAISAEHVGSRPSGGVGGTRVGVKCLHAHVAYALAGGDDAVGRWTLAQLEAIRTGPAWPVRPRRPTTGTTMNPDAGGLTVIIDDEQVGISMTGGATLAAPLGPVTLLDRQLERADPPGRSADQRARPRPRSLRRHRQRVADGSVHTVGRVVGPHADALARVEIGADVIPAGYRLRAPTPTRSSARSSPSRPPSGVQPGAGERARRDDHRDVLRRAGDHATARPRRPRDHRPRRRPRQGRPLTWRCAILPRPRPRSGCYGRRVMLRPLAPSDFRAWSEVRDQQRRVADGVGAEASGTNRTRPGTSRRSRRRCLQRDRDRASGTAYQFGLFVDQPSSARST